MKIFLKWRFLFLSAYFLFSFTSCNERNRKTPTKKVLFLGNSITQHGTYISVVDYYLGQYEKDTRYELIGLGLGSETVSCLSEPDHPFPRPCLLERLDRALTKTKPDVVVACYGMNDGIYYPFDSSHFAAFQKGIFQLIKSVQAIEADLILLTPPPFDTLPISKKVVGLGAEAYSYLTPYEGYNTVLGNYAEWLISLKSTDIEVMDVHGTMQKMLSFNRLKDPGFSFSNDGIHPNFEGHLVIGLIILHWMDIYITDPPSQLATQLQADTLFQLIDQRRKMLSDVWLPYVGYVRKDSVFQNDLGEVEAELKVINQAIEGI